MAGSIELQVFADNSLLCENNRWFIMSSWLKRVRSDLVMFYSLRCPESVFTKHFVSGCNSKPDTAIEQSVTSPTCDIFRPKTKFIKLSISYDGCGRWRVSRPGRQRWWKEEKTRGGWFIDMQLSTELWHDNICNVDIDLTLTTGGALQTWSIHRSSGRVWGGQET